MSIRTLNRWRIVYLAETLVYIGIRKRSAWWHTTVLLGIVLWCTHDAAHGRWRTLLADATALIAELIGGIPGRIVASLAVAYTVAGPEREPSPHLWSGWLARRRVRHSP
ncbi:MAG: hypothetical protein JO247_18430 [Chloroflexi bacterium]|nr:hypothetical protein [Chloroflexota bacterium]